MFVRMDVVPSSENAGTFLCCGRRASMASGDSGSRVMAGVPWDDSERETCRISDFPGRLDSLHRGRLVDRPEEISTQESRL
jgi:hypothetical protein